MTDAPRALVRSLLRVPAAPEPPPGDPSRLRVFRAGPGHLRYKTVVWAMAQAVALAFALVFSGIGLASLLTPAADLTGLPWIALFVGAPVWILFAAQLLLSYFALRLDHEMRWYMLGEQALRIREGILTVGERTMSYENVQQVSVRRGPLQSMLGIGDIEVRSAGGGGRQPGGRDEHSGYFRGVSDPEAVSDLIRSRVERHRSTGLGEESGTEDGRTPGDSPAARWTGPRTRAAQSVLEEIRGLRADLTHSPPPA